MLLTLRHRPKKTKETPLQNYSACVGACTRLVPTRYNPLLRRISSAPQNTLPPPQMLPAQQRTSDSFQSWDDRVQSWQTCHKHQAHAQGHTRTHAHTHAHAHNHKQQRITHAHARHGLVEGTTVTSLCSNAPFTSHPTWSTHQVYRYRHRRSVEIVPDARSTFLKTVPLATAFKLCRLDKLGSFVGASCRRAGALFLRFLVWAGCAIGSRLSRIVLAEHARG